MLDSEIKQENFVKEEDKKVVDDLMSELENFGAKLKTVQSTKKDYSDEDKKKKHHRRSPDSKHDRKKSRYNFSIPTHSFLNLKLSSHKERKRRRRSSTGSYSSSRSSSNDRSPSPKHHRSSKKSRHHDRNESPPPKKRPSVPDKPVAGSIYDGTVTSIMNFGCFVRLDQFRNRTEGLVHISNVNILIYQFIIFNHLFFDI